MLCVMFRKNTIESDKMSLPLHLPPPLQEKASEHLCFSLFFFPPPVSVSKLMSHHMTFGRAKCWYCFDCRNMERCMTQHLIKMHLHAQSNFTSVLFENFSNYLPLFWSIFLPKWPIITYYYYWAVNASLIIHLFFWFAEAEKAVNLTFACSCCDSSVMLMS